MDFAIHGNIVYNNVLWETEELCRLKKKFDVFLQRENIHTTSTIALAMERTPRLLTAVMSLLDQGVVFLPIDRELPAERLQYMLDTAEIDYIITDGEWIQERKVECPVLFFDQTDLEIPPEPVTGIPAGRQELAYLLFTSGTTGRPKAVEVRREGLLNFISAMLERIDFPAESRIACCTSEMFDIFFLESVLALCTGMTVVLADQDERKNPRMVCKLLQDEDVNVIQMTPSYLQMIQSVDPEYHCLEKMAVIMVGGESFPLLLLEKLRAVTKARIYNMYGPTETTIWSLVADLTNSREVVIGQPVSGTEVLILSENEQIVEAGQVGEICISGRGLARGYRNNEEQTQKSFKTLQYGEQVARIYKTGDLGCKKSDGNYTCLGRKDNQIKILGHRIELEEIDECMKQISYITNAVSCLKEDTHGKKIICFYTAVEERAGDDLRKALGDKLPSYMLPARFVKVDDFLYTISAKIDRSEMVHRYCKEYDEESENRQDKKCGSRQWVIQCFGGLLETEKGNIQDHTPIETLGIDSLTYINFIVQAEEELGIEIDDEYLASGSFSTVGDIIQYFDHLRETGRSK